MDNQTSKAKRIAALLGVILLVSLYIVTFIVSVVDKSSGGKLFSICLVATLVIPIMSWITIWMVGKLSGKGSIADFDRGVKKNDVNKDNE
ncbi:MAG: hypothetical protein K6F84_01855 [Lachnospiraceae bacterium]|nr:hypothetical protein [Lachnospiraceae bacterium]